MSATKNRNSRSPWARWPSSTSAARRRLSRQDFAGGEAADLPVEQPTYGAPSDGLVLSRSAFSMRDRMEAISATARIHHTSCRRCPYWTADGYRSDTQGLPPRYADLGSADESRERSSRQWVTGSG